MIVKEAVKEHPQDYFMGRLVDEGTEFERTIYDQPNEVIDDYLPNKAIRKKVFGGHGDLILMTDRIQVRWNGTLVAEAQLVAQLSDNGGTSFDYSYDFNFLQANINLIDEEQTDEGPVAITPFYRAFEVKDFPALSITDAVMGMDQQWAFKKTKQSFYLDVPGWLCRIRWQVRVLDSALGAAEVKGLRYSVSDYTGEVLHGTAVDPEPGWTQHWWTFEPDGFQCPPADARTPAERFEDKAGLLVDPYLAVDEPTGYIDIYCDGYVMRFDLSTSAQYELWIYDSTITSPWFGAYQRGNDGTYSYYYTYDGARVVEILESTPERVVIRAKSNWDRTDGATNDYWANSDYIERIYTIYPDFFTVDFKWVVSGNITNTYAAIFGMRSQAGLSSPNNVYQNGASESDTSDSTDYNSANYIAIIHSTVNAQVLPIEDNFAALDFRNVEDGWCDFYEHTTNPITAGTYYFRCKVVIDAAAREGSAQIYNSTDRLAIGVQNRDQFILLPEYEDDFNRSDGEIGASWIEDAGDIDIVSNEAVPQNAASWDRMRYATQLGSTAHWAEVKLNPSATTNCGQLYVRQASSTHTCYALCFVAENQSNGIQLRRIVSGGETTLVNISNLGYYYTDDPTIRLSVCDIAGNPVLFYEFLVDGKAPIRGSYTDTNASKITSGQYVGLASWSNTARFDDFKCGTLTLDQAGAPVYDSILPVNLSSGGLCSDGAQHFDIDATNKNAKYTLDIPRYRVPHNLHDWPFYTGTVASPTDHLLCHLKLDENAASSNLNDETANNADATWSNVSGGTGRNTNTSGDSVQVIGRGRNLDTQSGAGYIELVKGSGTVHDNDFLLKGSIIVKVMPQFVYTSANIVLWQLRYDSGNRFMLYYDGTADRFRFVVYWAGTGLTTIYGPASAFTENYSLQRQMILHCAWDSDKDFAMLKVDNDIEWGINTATPTTSHPAYHTIAADYNQANPMDMIIDEVKTFDCAVLPYGGYHIGNGVGLNADISNPHAHLTFFADCQSVTAYGGSNLATEITMTNNGGSFTSGAALVGTYGYDTGGGDNGLSFTNTSDNYIDPLEGTLLIWFNIQSWSNHHVVFQYYYDANNYILLKILDDDGLEYRYCTGGNTNSAQALDAGVLTNTWYCAKCEWKQTEVSRIWLDGKFIQEASSVTGTWSGSAGTMNLGQGGTAGNGMDVFIGRVFISNKVGTPEVWTNFGKPRHMPITGKS